MASTYVLNPQQVKAITHENGPLLIIAGAGTGKTTVITQRITHLILEKKIDPSQILALTFTEKAAREMEERIDIALPYGYTDLWISTFHAFCDRILRAEGINIGLTPQYKLMTTAESILFLRKNLFALKLDYFRPLGNPNKFLEGLLQHFSRLKDEDISPSQYLAWAKDQGPKTKDQNEDQELEIKKYLELANAYKTYEDLKNKEGVMDFSDMISNTLLLFRTRKNILKRYQKKFKFILVDEFQDTNFSQNELAILLAGENQNITAVADDDQSIYAFRGAAISNVLRFRERFKNTSIVTLTNNYRSTQEILNASYKLIQHNNPDRLEVKENIDKKLTSRRKVKGKPAILLFGNRVEDEADLVAKKIEEIVNSQKPKANDQKPTTNDYKDIAILIRANDHALPFILAFDRQKIPYQFLGPGKLFQTEEIKDVIAYLKVLYNFEDATSLYRVLTMPIFKISGRDIADLLNLAKKKNYSLFEALEITAFPKDEQETFLQSATIEKYKKIITLIKSHMQIIKTETAGQILYDFLQKSGFLENLLHVENEKDEVVAQNISRFFEKIKSYEVSHDSSNVYDVVDWLDLSLQVGESPMSTDSDWSENNAVNILTIHSSKGLEFNTVFLVNLVTQRFPSRERNEQIPIPDDIVKEILPEGDFHLQEERRLFYVGITRARDSLFLTAANYYGEGKRERKLSPFVYEILGKEETDNLLQKKKIETSIIQPSLLDWNSNNHDLDKELKTNDQKPKAKLTYISYSQLACFDFCPLHYKLKYILKIPTPASSAQSFGTSVHAALRDFYQMAINGEKVQSTDIENLLQNNWINEGYDSKMHEEEALKKAKEILKNYVKANSSSIQNAKSVELPFQFPLSGIRVGGRIDRIDENKDGTIEIIDYKTGTNVPDTKKLAKDLQLTFYALAATEVHSPLFNKPAEKILLSLHYLEKELKLTTTRTPEQLEAAKLEIMEKVKIIEESDFACSGSSFCKNCEYKMLCRV